jgi:four helix bundle protein
LDISHLSLSTKSTVIAAMTHKRPELASGATATATAREPQSQADALEERLIDFAVRIVKLSASLPKTSAGRHMAGQILRSGTSPAPNYGEARGAESEADFIHKLRIVLKELNETSIWLRVIQRSELVKSQLLADIIQETGELCRIFVTSIRTAKSRNQINK